MAFSQWIENDPANGPEAIFDIKEMLKAAGWTVPQSSDGTTYNAGGDQITHAGSGAGGMDNTNAWFVIQNPDGVAYCIQAHSFTYQWRVKYSPSGGFPGGSPSATETPSATNEGLILGSGTDASPGFTTFFPVTMSHRHKGGADDASPYHFWSAMFPIGGGATVHAFVHEGLDALEPTDGAPYHCVLGDNALNSGNLRSSSTSGNSTRSHAPPVAVSPSGTTVCPADNSSLFPSNLPVSPITGKDESMSIIYGRNAGLSDPGWKGIGSMMRWLGIARTTGDTLTFSTTRDRIVIDSVSLPWKGTVPTI